MQWTRIKLLLYVLIGDWSGGEGLHGRKPHHVGVRCQTAILQRKYCATIIKTDEWCYTLKKTVVKKLLRLKVKLWWFGSTAFSNSALEKFRKKTIYIGWYIQTYVNMPFIWAALSIYLFNNKSSCIFEILLDPGREAARHCGHPPRWPNPLLHAAA